MEAGNAADRTVDRVREDCAPDRMSAAEAITFLEIVIDYLQQDLELLQEENAK